MMVTMLLDTEEIKQAGAELSEAQFKLEIIEVKS